MATTLSHLIVRLDADIGNLQKKMTAAERAVDKMADSAQRAGKVMTAALTLPIAALGGFAVKAAVDMDKLKRGLEVSAGSAEAAAQQLKALEVIARQPGLGFKEAIRGAVQLNTVLADLPNNLSYTNRLLAEFGNAIALTGGGKAELDRVITQLGQIAASGRVLTQDLRPIIQTAPAVATALKRAFGTIDAQEIEKLGLSSQEFFDRLLEGLGSMERAAAGPANAFENFTDSVFRAGAAIGEKLLPVVTPLVDGLASMLEEIEGLDAATVQWGISIAAALAVIGPATVAVSGLVKAVVALKVAGAAAAGVFGLGGLLVAGLTALASLWIKNRLEAAAFRAEMERIPATLDKTQLAGQKSGLLAEAEKLRRDMERWQRSIDAGINVNQMTRLVEAGRSRLNQIGGELGRIQTALEQTGEVLVRTAERSASAFEKLWAKYKGLLTSAPNVRLVGVGAAAPPIIKRDASTGRITVNAEGELKGFVTALRPATEHMSGLALQAARVRVGFDNVVGTFREGFSRIFTQFGPQALVMGALFDIFKGALEALKPVLDALREPLQIIGTLLGQVLGPIIKNVLVPPLKILAIVVTGIIQAIGWLIEAIGKAIDRIPGISAKGLIEFGQNMQDQAEAARRAIRAQDEATESLTALTDAIIGAVAGFKIAQYRFEATAPSGPASPPSTGGGGGSGGGGGGGSGGVTPVDVGGVHITTSGDGRETYRNFYNELDQRTRGTDARAFFHALPAPA